MTASGQQKKNLSSHISTLGGSIALGLNGTDRVANFAGATHGFSVLVQMFCCPIVLLFMIWILKSFID